MKFEVYVNNHSGKSKLQQLEMDTGFSRLERVTNETMIRMFFEQLLTIKNETMFELTRTTIIVSNGRYTFYQIHFIKHNL